MGDRQPGRSRRVRRSALLASVLGLSAVTGAGASVSAVRGTTLSTEKVRPGKVVVVGNRRAVYMFSKDSTSRSSCTGACARSWPPVIALGKVSVATGSGLNAKLLGRVRRSDGRMQVTYNHHLLYTYAGDRKPGQIMGEGASVFGGHWYLVGTSGAAVKPKKQGGVCNPLCQSY